MNKNIFKVIKIIDEYSIVINAGSNNKIKKDDTLQIFEPGEEIFDPDTKESLGTLDTIKATVKVINVFPKMCLCRHIIEKKMNPLETFTEPLSAFTRYQTVSKRLNVDSTQISGGLSNDKEIRIGDFVRPTLD